MPGLGQALTSAELGQGEPSVIPRDWDFSNCRSFQEALAAGETRGTGWGCVPAGDSESWGAEGGGTAMGSCCVP